MSEADAKSLAHDLGAVSDPVRLQMLSILAGAENGEVCACDFVGPIGKSQPTVSHHLKVLAEAGLVVTERRGRWIWYRLAPGRVEGLVSALTAAATAPGG
jgi:ArsR family transcriptional regulator